MLLKNDLHDRQVTKCHLHLDVLLDRIVRDVSMNSSNSHGLEKNNEDAHNSNCTCAPLKNYMYDYQVTKHHTYFDVPMDRIDC